MKGSFETDLFSFSMVKIVIVLACIASYEGSAFIEMRNKLSLLTMPHVMDDRFATYPLLEMTRMAIKKTSITLYMLYFCLLKLSIF